MQREAADMAYRTNFSAQISMDDSFERLTDRQKKVVLKSWAKGFADQVFPAIDSAAFKVLYKDNDASRPATPANYVVGALIIKEMFGLTDDETVEMIQCDVRAQYALHSTSLEEQPISDRTFSRFRERLYNYEQSTGTDLLKIEMEKVADQFCGYLNINKKLKRMDSLMIAMHAKTMSRLEIIYTTVAKCVQLLKKTGHEELIPEDMKHYLDQNDLNEVIYYAKDEDVEPRLQKAIDEAVKIKAIMDSDEWYDSPEYQLLLRVLNEQSEDGKPKDKNQIKPDSLQNPNDPDATYRKKAGKDHNGYVGNIVEAVGDNGASQIVNFDYDQNNHADQEYSRDYLENSSDETVIADGAYGSVDLQNLAEENNINLVTTSLTGKETDPVFADFKLNEEGNEVIACPKGNEPVNQKFYQKTEMIRIKMNLCDCSNCPLKENCHVKLQKKSAVIMVSKKMVRRAAYLKKLGTEEYIQLTRKRNAVEGIMSVMRRRYHVDSIPVFGRQKSKIFFYFKVGAFNVTKLLLHMQQEKENTDSQLAMA